MNKFSLINELFSLFIKCHFLLTKEHYLYYNNLVFVNAPTGVYKRKKL